jgi:hypothetical protein
MSALVTVHTISTMDQMACRASASTSGRLMVELIDHVSDHLQRMVHSPWLWIALFLVAGLDASLPFMPSETTVIGHLCGAIFTDHPAKALLLAGAIGLALAALVELGRRLVRIRWTLT